MPDALDAVGTLLDLVVGPQAAEVLALEGEFADEGAQRRVVPVPAGAHKPGLTETELGTHLASAGLVSQLDGMFEALGGPAAEEVADVVACVSSRPRHVNLRQIMVLPTRQA
jgi:hypothetical protein